VTTTDARLLAAAHAIERTPAFRATFTPREPPLATTHSAALEFAHAALEAAAPPVTGTAVSIPPQAITAAASVLHDEYCDDGDTRTCGRWNSKVPGGYGPRKHIGFYEDRAREVLEAAEPFLAAGQRERDAQLAIDQADLADSQALVPQSLIPAITLREFADLLREAQP
jgi:hypothetical protein